MKLKMRVLKSNKTNMNYMRDVWYNFPHEFAIGFLDMYDYPSASPTSITTYMSNHFEFLINSGGGGSIVSIKFLWD